ERDFEQDRQTLLVGKACGIDALIERSGERQPNRHYPVLHHLIEYLLALGWLEPGHIDPVDAKARIRKSPTGRNREQGSGQESCHYPFSAPDALAKFHHRMPISFSAPLKLASHSE